ncbi:hypothetical protein EFA69_04520 [Rufibacter immobilis]|uniref:Tail specific protease domain-containing protein n=1 Tax=Rufibacter immobilis TaxID=1348778 RepID=A0A3M9N5K0_9BACT|nr:S41 family peptidase [Rufibacter immobilis]RNI32587.1 hypothetical protein EFA69_04520 [Rufibacter immobilis]
MKQKYLLLVFFLLLMGKSAVAQNNAYGITDSVKAYLDKGLTVLQTHSLNRDVVNWEELRAAVYQKARGAKAYEDVLPVYPFLFEQLKDHHGWFTYKGKNYSWQRNPAQPRNAAVVAELKKKPKVEVNVLKNGIGYILLPGNSDFGMTNVNRDAQAIRDSISKIHPGKIKGWIIDLRLNTGGNMYPMFGGLAQLIGDGKVGGFVTKNQKPEEEWSIRGGNFYVNTAQVTNVPQVPQVAGDAPMAVLLSNMTASAGEAVAISLKGRPSTRFFGETTHGLTTANEGFQIDKNSGLTLAVLYEADRNGMIYQKNIKPDEEILNGDDFTNWKKDQKITAAMKWLKKEIKAQKR